MATGEDQTFLLGHGYGLAQCDPVEDGWTRATEPTSRVAEIDALIHAIEWALQHMYTVDTVFCFDAIVAGHAAEGRWKVDLHDKQAVLLRCLAQDFQATIAKEAKVAWEHVRGHCRHLGNEIADSLARHALRNQCAFGAVNYLPYIVGDRPMISWMWLASESFNTQTDLPPLENT